MYPSYPPKLTKEQEDYLLTNLKDWSIAHGLAVRPSPAWVSTEQDPSGSLATTAPVTLFPSLFPRVCFEQARSVVKAYNELYSAIASDESWLGDIVKELIEIDDFMANLWKIHVKIKEEGYAHKHNLGLFRSDYMVHVNPESPQPCVRQVEFNTIASSFGGLSSAVSKLHRYLLDVGAYPNSVSSIITDKSLPASTSARDLAHGIAKAHKVYGTSSTRLPTCVIFLVQDVERNVFDQRHLEYSLHSEHRIPVYRLQFDRVLTDTRLDSERKLIYTSPHNPEKRYEVSVVYLRAGYSPSEYEDQSAWDARLHLERSAAIKCPSVLLQLAGTKKVQQVLATPHSPHLKRFLPEETQADEVLKTFAPIYPLDKSEAGLEARKLATDPEAALCYVAKPQREGGGNNIYRKAIPDFLKGMPEPHWPAYILMEMIEPPSQSNVIFRNGETQEGGVICELGVYGVCIWEQGNLDGHRKVLENSEAGYLLRTKGDASEEGGVAAGFGAVDSAALIDV